MAFENEDDVIEFVKCKIESLMANKEPVTEGWNPLRVFNSFEYENKLNLRSQLTLFIPFLQSLMVFISKPISVLFNQYLYCKL